MGVAGKCQLQDCSMVSPEHPIEKTVISPKNRSDAEITDQWWLRL
jgi:hypothetical protein